MVDGHFWPQRETTDFGVVAVAAHTVCERTRKNEDRSDVAAQCIGLWWHLLGRAGCGRDGRKRRTSISAEKTRQFERELREHQQAVGA